MNPTLKRQLGQLPDSPGIYKFFDADGELIYVGKAVNLKNRVKSYFTGSDHSPKTRVLVSHISRLETIRVESEVDALILETNLIKEHRPRYNIILKDDKSHLYIKVTLYEELPRVSTCRQTDMALDPKATYFGPFPSSGTVKQTLRYLRRVFPYLARHQPPVAGRRRPPQSYFYYNLPLGPVDEQIDKKIYRQQVFQLVHFLDGQRGQVQAEVERAMKASAKHLDFESAAQFKQQLDGLLYISQAVIRPESYIANPELVADNREQGLRELAEILRPYYPEIDPGNDEEAALRRIECFDISNTGGQQAVGSMVVFTDGAADKGGYRRFRIRREQAPNDTAMMAEVLMRRTKRLGKPGNDGQTADTSFSAVPQLIIVDGGKGQLAAGLAVLHQAGLQLPIVGMTKRDEELVVYQPGSAAIVAQAEADSGRRHGQRTKPKRSAAHGSLAVRVLDTATVIKRDGNFDIVRLPRGSQALFLVQRIRDEAHRFAISYHRKLRGQVFLKK